MRIENAIRRHVCHHHGIASREDMIPTLLAAVGEPDIKEKLKTSHTVNGKKYKDHLDGYNLLPWLKGGQREIMYFDEVGARQWLVSFEEFPPVRGNTLGIDGVVKQLENPAARQ
ncbi:MAG TPA: hypothetical protein VMW70_10445 [Burkholderiales bacterium]|nr:hypothetical protein [Burkholderiales bacterium]